MPARKRSLGLIVDKKTSLRMGGIRQRGTDIETAVAAMLGKLGYRSRRNNRDLPGSPDFANRTRRWAIFVHGCFWHRHAGCRRTTTPKRNRDFWVAKFEANVARDKRTAAALGSAGYLVLSLWECDVEQRPADVARLLAESLAPLYVSV